MEQDSSISNESSELNTAATRLRSFLQSACDIVFNQNWKRGCLGLRHNATFAMNLSRLLVNIYTGLQMIAVLDKSDQTKLTDFEQDSRRFQHKINPSDHGSSPKNSILSSLARTKTPIRTHSQSSKIPGPVLLDLPDEILLMIVDLVVADSSNAKWNAYCFHKQASLGDHKTYHSNTRPYQLKYEEHGRPTHENLVIWRSNRNNKTTSVLLTNQKLHNLAVTSLSRRFSGILRFAGRERSSQLDTVWPWHTLTLDSPVVQRYQWLFNRVLVLETHHHREVWQDMFQIMPNLRQVRLIPDLGPIYEAKSDPNEPLEYAQLHASERFFNGKFDEMIGVTAKDMGREWIRLCQSQDSSRRKMIQVSISVRVGPPWQSPDSLWLTANVELWPESGKVVSKHPFPW